MKLYLHFLTILSILFAFTPSAHAVHVASKSADIDITTSKTAHVIGVIDAASAFVFGAELAITTGLSGPRVIIIDSPGGYVDAGASILDMMRKEQAAGVKQICVVKGMAASMAFNILSACDIRLAADDARMLFHKIAIGQLEPGMRGTAKTLREIANYLDKEDEPYCALNSKALNFPRSVYDRLADMDTWWSPKELLDLKYLQGIVLFK